MPLRLRPMRPADLPAYDRVIAAAFANGLYPYLYPNGKSEVDRAQTFSKLLKALRDQGSGHEAGERYMVVEDTDLEAPDQDGVFPPGFEAADECEDATSAGSSPARVVGASIWTLYPQARSPEQVAADSEYRDTPPPSANAPLYIAFRNACAAARTASLGGNPYVLLQVLATDPVYGRRGIGTLQLNWGLEIADSLGLPVWLEASETGKPLYAKNGFRDEKGLEGFDSRDYGAQRAVEFTCMARPATRKGEDEEMPPASEGIQ